MRRALFALGAMATAAAVALPGAFGSTAATPGVTAKTIKIGGTFPLSGPASSYAPIARGMKAYFSHVNATKGPDGKRGVGGRQIIWKFYDDGYNPAQTVQRTRQLVEQDKVFALVGGLGTEPTLAVRDYANQKKVPQIYVSTGATTWGFDHGKYLWTIGWQPDYQAESALYGRDIAKNRPSAKIAIIYQSDDYGRDYIAGFEAGLGKAHKGQIIATRGFEVTAPSVLSQVLDLAKSGADTLAIFATPSKTIQTYATMARIGWKPKSIYLNSVSATQAFMAVAVRLAGAAAVNGSVSVTYLKDPANPKWNNDDGMQLYQKIMAKYLPGANVKDQLYLYGMAKAYTTVQALRAAGKNPTRASLMKAVDNMNDKSNPFLLPGVITKTGPKDAFPISQQRLVRFNNGGWTEFGPLYNPRPKG